MEIYTPPICVEENSYFAPIHDMICTCTEELSQLGGLPLFFRLTISSALSNALTGSKLLLSAGPNL